MQVLSQNPLGYRLLSSHAANVAAGTEDVAVGSGALWAGDLLLPARLRAQSPGEPGCHSCIVSYGGH